MKYSMKYIKGNEIRFLGHLDIVRTIEKALRRAGLPMAYAGDFNPRPKVIYLSPLPVGVEGLEEQMQIELVEDLPASEVIERFNKVLMPGLKIMECLKTEKKIKQEDISKAEYVFTFLEKLELESIRQLLAMDKLEYEKTTKNQKKIVDLKKYLYSYDLTENTLRVECATGDVINIRPNEILGALKISQMPIRIVRSKLF